MYNTIKLEKGLYSMSGKSFTQALAELDPDSNYKGTELEGLDAFERQLKRFDIKISGKNSDMVEKFFLTSESSVLFPEYVRRTVKQGMEEASVLGDIASTISYIDALDFRGFSLSTASGDSAAEQAVNLKTNTVKLASPAKEMVKFGRALNFSYESIRKQRLDSVGVFLKRMGAQISSDLNSWAIGEIIDGVTASTVSGTAFTYNDLASFWASLGGYNTSVVVVSPTTLANILSLEQMKYCQYDCEGNAVRTPFGLTLVQSTAISDNQAVGIDTTCGIEVLFGTDLIIETDKDILPQCSMITASITAGVSKLTSDSVKVMATN